MKTKIICSSCESVVELSKRELQFMGRFCRSCSGGARENANGKNHIYENSGKKFKEKIVTFQEARRLMKDIPFQSFKKK